MKKKYYDFKILQLKNFGKKKAFRFKECHRNKPNRNSE